MVAAPKSVLIVEDEKPLLHALQLKLQGAGMVTVVARDGQECLEVLAKQRFDVLLLDLMLPVLDGFQVLERIGQMPVKPTVFVLSNLSQIEDEQRVLALGAKKFFVKSDTALATIVEEVKKLI